jgi:hypothetical protein
VNNQLIDITKKLCSAWARSQPHNPERVRLTDKFLDIIAGHKEPADPAATTTDAERWKADAEGWKAEAERWRTTAENNGQLIEWMNGALDAAGAPTHHQDIGAPARKPMMPQERIAALKAKATMTDGQRTFDAGGWMNECLCAEERADRLQAAVDSVIDQLNRVSVETPNPDQP